MNHSSLPRAAAVLSLLAVLALAHAAATYLRARAAACLTEGAGLRDLCLPGWRQLAREQVIARGLRLGHAALGHKLTTSVCQVTVETVTLTPDGRNATVKARAVTTTGWTAGNAAPDREATGVDHTIALRLVGSRWLVTGDAYCDDLVPRYLEAGGASRAVVRTAADRLEARSRTSALPAPTGVTEPSDPVTIRAAGPIAADAGARGDARPRLAWNMLLGYRPEGVYSYDRNAAKAYADKYALSYNPTYRAFAGVDCANFGSQTMLAGGYPKAFGGYEQGWWYDKAGSPSPGDDTWSHSWIAVILQMLYWNSRYTDVENSISDCGKGDFVYYDWTGNGSWDHVAELVGMNSSGQKVIDAHTTDHYHVYWKLGTSSTRYLFARTRPQIYIR